MKKVLVTGGAGYIGSHIVRKLVKKRFEVIVLDNLVLGHSEAIDPKAKFEKVDLKNKKTVDRVFKKYQPEAVIDFAAFAAVGESMEEPEKYLGNNIYCFLNLLEVMIENDCKYLIKSSTSTTYGSPQKETDFPLKEDYQNHHHFPKSVLMEANLDGKKLSGERLFQKLIAKIQAKFPKEYQLTNSDISKLRIPTSAYGLTKLADEVLMKKFWQEHKLSSVALRYFNACGADDRGDIGEDHTPELALIPNVISTVLGFQDKFYLNGNDYPTPDGTCIRDYVHVNDLAIGHIKALEFLRKNPGFHIFNLGSGKGFSNMEIIRKTEEIAGKRIKIEILPRRGGDAVKVYGDCRKAKNLLDWTPKYNLDKIIRTAFTWHKNHPKGF